MINMYKETEIKVKDFSNIGICKKKKKESNGNSRTGTKNLQV